MWKNEPIQMKLGTCIKGCKKLACAEFYQIKIIFERFTAIKRRSGGDLCMGGRWNNGPILTNLNRFRPCTKRIICAKFHQDILKIATCSLITTFTWTDEGRTDGRTDIVKSTQEVILSRLVYFKVGVQWLFLYVTISAQTHYTLSTYGGVGYNKSVK